MATGLSLVVGGGDANGPFGERFAEQNPRAPFEQPGPEGSGERPRLPSPRLPTPPLPTPERPTLSELFAASPRDGGAMGFLLAQLPVGKPLLWVQERMAILEGGRVYPPGLPFDDFIHVEVRDARAALWAMEEGLRCSALGAVIGELWGEPGSLDFTATRRLAVAAERHGVAAWLLRLGGSANLSGARMRWRVGSAPSVANPLNARAPGAAAWNAELFRARGHMPGRWVVQHDRAAPDPVAVVAAPGDRALGAGHRRLA